MKNYHKFFIMSLRKDMTIIFYAYHETESCHYNLKYFLKYAILPQYRYVFIVNGRNCTVAFPFLPNVRVMYRENEGFDFGGYKHALDRLGSEVLLQHEFFIFMNASVIGPLFRDPSSTQDWVELFHGRFKADTSVRLMGTTIVCLPDWDKSGKRGPRVEGFFFCTDKQGLELLMAESGIFSQHPTKESAIIHGEYAMSRCILDNGHNIGCMLNKYRGIDWRKEEYWGLNENKHPSRLGSYFGGTIDPFEVVFHKWFWHDMPLVNFEIVREHVEKRENLLSKT